MIRDTCLPEESKRSPRGAFPAPPPTGLPPLPVLLSTGPSAACSLLAATGLSSKMLMAMASAMASVPLPCGAAGRAIYYSSDGPQTIL